MLKAKEAVAAESLPRSLREIYQCYVKLADETQRAGHIPLLKSEKEVMHLTEAANQLE